MSCPDKIEKDDYSTGNFIGTLLRRKNFEHFHAAF